MRYPENYVGAVTWTEGDLAFTIIKCRNRHYCGYVRFPTRPLVEEGYHGIATYVPVHGGITYAVKDDDGSMIYGFDCAHAGDEEDPNTRDMDWLKVQCRAMATGIQIAAKHERNYLLARDDSAKATAIDAMLSELKGMGIMQNVTDNFGAMINVVCGRL